MTLPYRVVLRWRPEALAAAADELRRQVHLLEEEADRVRLAGQVAAGHWHGAAAEAARHRFGRSISTGHELTTSIEEARVRLEGGADALGSARSRVRSEIDDAESHDFRVAADGTVHPPYLPPPGLAPPSMGAVPDYVASFDARAARLLEEAADRTDRLRTVLREAELADEQRAATLRGLDLPTALLGEVFRLERVLPDAWGTSMQEVVFPDDWQPWPATSRGSDASWAQLVLLGACMPGGVVGERDDPDGHGTGYYGGGFVTGPDGHRYPLVVPQVVEGGRRFRANANVGDRLVEDLRGLDRGWHRVGSTNGIAQLGQDMPGTEKTLIGLGKLLGMPVGPGTGLVRRNDLLPRLRIDRLRAASLTPTGSALPRAPGRPDADVAVPLLDDPPGVHPDRAERVGGTISLVTDAAEAALLVERLDDTLTHGYHLTLQQNEDGRRRALLDVYDVFDSPDGTIQVRHHLGYLREDGTLGLAEASPLSTGAVVTQAPG
jgi:hypothetical protein